MHARCTFVDRRRPRRSSPVRYVHDRKCDRNVSVRLRNTGFTDASIRCMFPDAPPMVGYAVTARLRSGEPPIVGTFHDRADFWNSILEVPAPRILVLEDMDDPPGRGAFVGDMHAAILKALGCVGYVTNGAVRELPAVRKMGIQLFAGNVAVSHAYAHIFDIGAGHHRWNGSAARRFVARRPSWSADSSDGNRSQDSRPRRDCKVPSRR